AKDAPSGTRREQSLPDVWPSILMLLPKSFAVSHARRRSACCRVDVRRRLASHVAATATCLCEVGAPDGAFSLRETKIGPTSVWAAAKSRLLLPWQARDTLRQSVPTCPSHQRRPLLRRAVLYAEDIHAEIPRSGRG